MHLARLQRERHVAVGHQPAEALGDAPRLEQELARRRQGLRRQHGRARRRPRHIGPQEALPEPRHGRPQAVGETLQHDQHQQAEHDDLEIAALAEQRGQDVLELLLHQRDQRRAEHRAPQVAGTAHHRHEEVLDADVQVERRGVHEALQVRVQPARHRGKQRGQHEHLDAMACGVDTHRLGHHAARLERADGTPLAGVEQVVQHPQREQQHGPDHHAQHARGGERPRPDGERRHPGDAGVSAQHLEIAEQVVQAEAPGDGAQGQVVARQLQRDRTEPPRHREGEHDAEREADPRQRGGAEGGGAPGRRADPRRRVGPEAHERGLAERRHAAHAGQHHEPGGDHRVQADHGELGHGVVGQPGPGEREQHHRGEREPAPRHSSSSMWRLFSERHHSTGMISVKTSTSLNALAQNDENDSSWPTISAPTSASG